jgi:hypothetical protein
MVTTEVGNLSSLRYSGPTHRCDILYRGELELRAWEQRLPAPPQFGLRVPEDCCLAFLSMFDSGGDREFPFL